MKNAWKSIYYRLSSSSLSLLHARPSEHQIPKYAYSLPSLRTAWNFDRRYFSSEPDVDQCKHRDFATLADIFSMPMESSAIQAELESRKVSLDRDTVYLILRSFAKGNLETTRRFFDWVSDTDSEVLRSKSYNLMLGIVGIKGESREFWDLFETMKKKGFCISKKTYSKVLQHLLANNGKEDDFITRLKDLYLHNTKKPVKPMICKILRENEDPDEIQSKLQDLDITLTSELTVTVLKIVGSNPKKALIFLQWAEKSFEIDAAVYNAIAEILGQEDFINEFWDVLHKMRDTGFKMENCVYSKVSNEFHKRNMVALAVDLYEFAMAAAVEPPAADFPILLNKVAKSKDFDLTLISRIVRVFLNSGNTIKSRALNGILNSLNSADRLDESGKVLKAMEEGGFVMEDSMHMLVILSLCRYKRFDAACDYVKNIESFYSKAFELLIRSLCNNGRVMDAFKILKEMAMKKKYEPLESTYRLLIERLVNQESLKEATNLLELMKAQGFQSFVEPFVAHMSKSGTAADAMGFLKVVSDDKRAPPRAIYSHIFRALLNSGRREVAHDVLAESPASVRRHCEVLTLFHSSMPVETALA